MSDSFKNYALPISIFLAALLIGGVLLYLDQGEPGGKQGMVVGDSLEDGEGSSPSETVSEIPEVTKEDHVSGSFEAPVTILVYTDFECPYCGSFHSTLKEVMDEYGDQVRLVYRHFPLDFHPESMPSAVASECIAEQAGEEGFWQFADAVFEDQSSLGEEYYLKISQSIGVDTSQLKTCIDSEKYQEKIEQEMSEGKSAGVTGTPGNFINGKELRGAVPFDQLQTAIEEALAD